MSTQDSAPHVQTVPLRENALFRKLSPDLTTSETLSLSVIDFDTGQTIFAEGDASDHCYLVESGAVRITRTGLDGTQELLAIVWPGSFFGEMGLYDAAARSADATAVGPTRLGRLERGAFERLSEVAPLELMETLAEVNIARLRASNDLLVQGLADAGRLKAVGAELSTLSHNLRSPLGTIRNAADMLSEWLEGGSQDTSKMVAFVRIVQSTADRSLTQIDQLMARLRGEPSLERSQVSVGELLRDLREQVTGLIADPVVRYEDAQADHVSTVFVDRGEWISALSNLVKNSVEALSPKGGEVKVVVQEEDGEVIFTVQDSGHGIAPEKLPRFFDRGYTDGKKGGTGLGTAHVRSVVEAHGGTVDVRSEIGKGTSVLMRLPKLPA